MKCTYLDRYNWRPELTLDETVFLTAAFYDCVPLLDVVHRGHIHLGQKTDLILEESHQDPLHMRFFRVTPNPNCPVDSQDKCI